MKILLTGASTSDAYRIKGKLSGHEVLLGDYIDLPEFMVTTGKLVRLPKPDSVTYTHEMLTLCLDLGIEVLWVLRAIENDNLKEASQLFNEYGITLKTADEIQ